MRVFEYKWGIKTKRIRVLLFSSMSVISPYNEPVDRYSAGLDTRHIVIKASLEINRGTTQKSSEETLLFNYLEIDTTGALFECSYVPNFFTFSALTELEVQELVSNIDFSRLVELWQEIKNEKQLYRLAMDNNITRSRPWFTPPSNDATSIKTYCIELPNIDIPVRKTCKTNKS